jgi:8-oxo-dGTP diphosphatase
MNMANAGVDFHGAKLALFVGDALAVILRDDNPEIPWPNHWDMPGGGRENGETPLHCALRETHEELGVQIDPDKVIWGKRFDHPSGDKWFFVAHLPAALEDEIELGDEGQMWRLMTPKQYFDAPNNIDRFADRLGLYLAGFAGDLFERPPAK